MSNDMPFGFEGQISTTLRTNMLLETATHFVSEGKKIYIVLLDASNVFYSCLLHETFSYPRRTWYEEALHTVFDMCTSTKSCVSLGMI